VKGAASFGGLVRAMAGALLRRRSRPPGQALQRMALISLRVRVFVATTVLALAASVSTQAYGAPEPDPYQPKTSSPGPPAPDPYPSADSTGAPKAAPASRPSSSHSSPATTTASQGSTSAAITTGSRSAGPPRRRKPLEGAHAAPPSSVPHFPPRTPERTRAKYSAPVVVAASTGSGHLALGGLAVFALAVASGGLLILVSQADPWRART
jgi:hypothetical protein